ncbi:CHASE2 domain-containing protein [Allohahella marinimesophila]|uniref:histidine kinase n=1 Tax=Allohahella marinimesophila TaxID=1054972 RepID=A0ABP7P3H8_9GAMM
MPLTTHPKSFTPVRRMLIEPVLLGLALVALYAVLSLTAVFEKLDLFALDLALANAPPLTMQQSELVTIDERSIRAIGPWPWPRQIHAQLVDTLTAAGAEVIVFDILFSEPREGDARLETAFQSHGRIVLPMHTDGDYGVLPLVPLRQSSTRIGLTEVALDIDGIARRSPRTRSFKAAELVNMDLDSSAAEASWYTFDSLAEAAWRLRAGHSTSSLERRRTEHASDQILPRLGRSAERSWSYVDVLTPMSLPDLRGRTVFVGSSSPGLGDTLSIADTDRSRSVPGVVFHRGTFEAIAQQRLISPADKRLEYLTALAAIAIVVTALVLLPASLGLILVLLSTALVMTLSLVTLSALQMWLAPSAIVAVLLTAYPIWSWRRLTRTSRYLRHEILRLSIQPQLYEMTGRRGQDNGRWISEVCQFFQPLHYSVVDTAELSDQTLETEDEPLVDTDPDLVELSFELAPLFPDDARVRGPLPRVHMQFSGERRDELPEMQQHLEAMLGTARASASLADNSSWQLGSSERQIRTIRSAIDNLGQLNSFARTIINEVSDGIVVVGPTGCIVLLNKRARQILGKRVRHGDALSDHLPESRLVSRADWADSLRQAILTQTVHKREVTAANLAYIVSISPFRPDAKTATGAVVSLTDIFPIHEAQKDRLEAINFVSHDIRSPLASQLATFDALDSLISSIDSSQHAAELVESRERISDARRLAQKSLAMAEEFIQLAKLESLVIVERSEVSLQDLMDNAADAVYALAEKHQVRLQRSSRDEEELWVYCAPALIERALVNLLTNAIKHSAVGAVVVLDCFRTAQDFCLQITDQGEGIAEEELSHLFEAFTRTQASEREMIPGTGLGLRMVQVIVQKHGGHVSVQSSLGSGCRFTICLSAATNSLL